MRMTVNHEIWNSLHYLYQNLGINCPNEIWTSLYFTSEDQNGVSYKKLGNLCISYEPVDLQLLKHLCSLFVFVSLCHAYVCVCTSVCYVCVCFFVCVHVLRSKVDVQCETPGIPGDSV